MTDTCPNLYENFKGGLIKPRLMSGHGGIITPSINHECDCLSIPNFQFLHVCKRGSDGCIYVYKH